MDIWDEIKKLNGYQSGNGGVDSYGVDHSGFSTRDELEYQSARLARENQLAQNFANQGIAEENYPQFGTDFWGGSPENNYGFGSSNISQNIQNVTNQLNNSGFNNGANNGQVFANSDYTVNTESLVGKPSSYFQNNNHANIQTQNWESATEGKQVYDYMLQQEGSVMLPALNQPTLAPIDNTNSYTTESAWGYPNNTRSPYYQQMGELYNMNQSSSSGTASSLQPYIFSEDMRNRLGELESGNDYTKINNDGGGIGALGRYQIRRDGFKDAGYINASNQWAGKNDINSTNDYLNNSTIQEQALDDFMKAKYHQLQNNGSRQYLGYSVNGIVDNFDITDTGLLAASHREGAGAVHNYLSHLEKDENGRYYLNYNKISDPRQREMFRRIETRLRKFEK